MQLRVACVQAEPVILDAAASLDKAVRLIGAAADQGARFIVFPETFVPGYAQWTHSARFESKPHQALHARLCRESVRVPDDLDGVAAAAHDADVVVVLPVTEVDPRTPGTPYNTMAVFGRAPGHRPGAFLGKHRKLVPTHHERAAYGYGTGETMRAFAATMTGTDGTSETVRFGGLLCWNNYMPLARAALYAQGIRLYVAPTADDRDPQWQDAMRFIAHESRCFVMGVGLIQRKSSFPHDFELRDTPEWQAEDEWNERGGSCIVAPDGTYVAAPVWKKETLVVGDVDLDATVAARQTFDPSGHYGHRDLRLDVAGLEPL